MQIREQDGTLEAKCTKCREWKPATTEHFYYSTEANRRIAADGEAAVIERIARDARKRYTTQLRVHCRLCESRRERNRDEAPKVQTTRVEMPKVDDTYPRELHCPRGHGSHIFTSAIEEGLVGRCPDCGATLTTEAPAMRTQTEYFDLPTLPAIHHSALPAIVSAAQAGRHVYMAGTPGTGKSELARQVAEALALPFYMIACDSSMTRSTLMGLIDAGGTYHRTGLREAVENGGVFLIDEMDNGNPSLLAALNSAMSNGHVSFPDTTVEVHDDFRILATANTWGNGPTAEFVGRLKVDPATLDRFVRIQVDIDDRLERSLTVRAADGDERIAEVVLAAVRSIRREVETEGIRIIVSPRASMQVAALAARGWTVSDALRTTAVGTLEARRADQMIATAMAAASA